AALALTGRRGLVLSGEQADALAHITDGRDLGIVVGYAGTGKSAMLGVARQAWGAAGFEVRGAALSGIAAENLESGSGIASRTIASLEHGWSQGRDKLTAKDVLVIDEAGMVGTRQLERVLSHAADVGAKVVLVGDPQQLQAIEAGAAFRSIHDRHGGVEIGDVRRQRDDWQRVATRHLATGSIGTAVRAYNRNGMVHEAASREQARGDLIDRWNRDRQAAPEANRLILTHTNDEVRSLNQSARDRMRSTGNLGEDVQLSVERGARTFATGDRIMFLRNERSLGVKNGTLGTIEQVSAQSMSVRTDDGRSIQFDLKDYSHVDHGYAATIHKAQGMTVDHAHVLATPGMDAHSSYVALSRHRDSVSLHYGRDDFASQDRLITTMSRDRAKDMASDYEKSDPAQSYAERRGITFRERVVEIVRKIVPEKVRDRIDGLLEGLRSPGDGSQRSPSGVAPGAEVGRRPGREDVGAQVGNASAQPEREQSRLEPQRGPQPALDPEAALLTERTKVLIRHAAASDAILEAKRQGLAPSDEQRRELGASRRAFDEVRPHGWRDAEAAYSKDNSLAREAGSGNTARAIRALQLETEIRTEPTLRADRFVASWQSLKKTAERAYAAGDYAGQKSTRAAMGDMAKGLQRDPQLESLLANRKRELGISFETGRGVGEDLAFTHGLGRGRGIGL
ncbi:MAG: AAA family ATPase, partial [Rhizobiaceae bacterium]|nr:AAA family ATPase [Rhizobiaceae bacterium]